MNFKNLEEKCYYYRGLTDYKLLPNSNILVMLDGKKFSSLVKNNFKKPFDDNFIKMMNETAKYLCQNIQGAKFGYVQSDEISILITDYDNPKTDTLFGGRLCKIQSILAAMATAEFNRQFILYNAFEKIDNWSGVQTADIHQKIKDMKLAQFDCKAWVVPNENDAFAWFLFRNIDCIRNSKQQTAQTWCSYEELKKKNTDEQINYLLEKHGVDWNTFSEGKKYGRFIVRKEEFFTKEINGEVIPFSRNKFNIIDGFPLNEEGNKEKFFDYIKKNDTIGIDFETKGL